MHKARWIPTVTKQFPNYAPKELGQRAGEEDVVIVLRLRTKGTNTRRRPPTPPNVLIRWEALPSKLPKEDLHLHGHRNPPEVTKVFARGALIELKIKRADREPPRSLKRPNHSVLLLGDRGIETSLDRLAQSKRSPTPNWCRKGMCQSPSRRAASTEASCSSAIAFPIVHRVHRGGRPLPPIPPKAIRFPIVHRVFGPKPEQVLEFLNSIPKLRTGTMDIQQQILISKIFVPNGISPKALFHVVQPPYLFY
jgi:hypothetical protein